MMSTNEMVRGRIARTAPPPQTRAIIRRLFALPLQLQYTGILVELYLDLLFWFVEIEHVISP